MTREETVKLCQEAAESAVSAVLSSAGTGDAKSKWAEEATAWAVAAGIVEGFGNGDMGWQKMLTREQFAVMLYRFAKLIGKA